MNESTEIEQVRLSVTVPLSVERAFDLYARRIDHWWPRSAHVGEVPMREAVLEPRLGGRLYETREDGTEFDWGRILAWEPPTRLVFSWQISAEKRYIPDIAQASEVEVRFVSLADDTTTVELIHRNFHRHPTQGPALRASVLVGWPTVLASFTQKAA